MDGERWRTLDTDTRLHILHDITALFDLRVGVESVGRTQYGDEFQGDPLEQALEDALDTVFYIVMALRKRKEQEVKE